MKNLRLIKIGLFSCLLIGFILASCNPGLTQLNQEAVSTADQQTVSTNKCENDSDCNGNQNGSHCCSDKQCHQCCSNSHCKQGEECHRRKFVCINKGGCIDDLDCQSSQYGGHCCLGLCGACSQDTHCGPGEKCTFNITTGGAPTGRCYCDKK